MTFTTTQLAAARSAQALLAAADLTADEFHAYTIAQDAIDSVKEQGTPVDQVEVDDMIQAFEENLSHDETQALYAAAHTWATLLIAVNAA